MGSLFSSTLNTRYLPDGSRRFLRSDAPVRLTGEEIQWLREHGFTTVIDLREDAERAQKPCVLDSLDGFAYHHLPVTGGGRTPVSREDLQNIYLSMLDEQMERIVSAAMNAPSGVLFFCTAGKDRTGVVSAVILRSLGVPDDVIVSDYLASGENLSGMLTAYAAAHPEVDLALLLPRPETIRLVLDRIGPEGNYFI